MTGSLSLVGREPELARLQELLTTVRGGASASLLLRGEPGVGKSALLEQLFLSPRTVEWHLKHVFAKLGISSRRALRDALPREAAAV